MASLTVPEIASQIKACHGNAIDIRYCKNSLSDTVHHVSVHEATWDAWGFGDGSDPANALIKAYYECIERIAYKNSGIETTNGFAAHVTRDQAAEKAAAELIERDLFLATWFARRPPLWLSDAHLLTVTDDWGRDCLRFINASGITARFGICGVSDGRVVMAGLIDGRHRVGVPFAYSAIPGIGRTIDESLRCLLLDLMRIITGINTKAEDTKEFKVQRIGGHIAIGETFDHLDYFLELGNADKMDWYLSNETVEAPVVPALDISLTDIAVPVRTAFPLVVVRADSPDAQKYFVGVARPERLSWPRLAHFGIYPGADIPLVHPIP